MGKLGSGGGRTEPWAAHEYANYCCLPLKGWQECIARAENGRWPVAKPVALTIKIAFGEWPLGTWMRGLGIATARQAGKFCRRLSAVAGLLTLHSPSVMAQSLGADANGIPPGSLASAGEPDARRKALADRGITYGLNYVGELQYNAVGGIRTGGVYVGRLEGIVELDLGKLAGAKGLTFHANAFQINGKGLTPDFVGSLAPASYIEARATTRLSELWLEQKFANDKASIRFGQLAADVEFFASGYASQFINGTFGTPVGLAVNWPSGGPTYPFATPGVRLKIDPNANTSLLAAVFNGDPAGPSDAGGDPQSRNRYGLNFRVQDAPLLIAEAQFRANQDKGAAGLARTIKIGGWNHFGRFDDQRFGTDGLSLADPASNGVAVARRGNRGIYGMIDQQIWRPASGEADKGIGVFGRVFTSPSDRNLVDLYLDGGIVFAGLMPVRPDDVLSFGAAYSRISDRARALDADTVAFNGTGLVRSAERVFTINYQAQVRPGWQVDLDFQRFVNPSGGVANPASPAGAMIPSASVLTLHTSLKY